ncbi:MAG: DUF547 domain-containing protein [Lewinellaceae bacterium]|nr:DUF547 domain-containing protein [Lewinellaceae bacterium]
MNLNDQSEKLLYAAKTGRPTEALVRALAETPFRQLTETLRDDTRKLAFWINAYNAYFLILRHEKGLQRPDIFKQKAIRIGGRDFSLDDIEHGILRRNRWKWSLGYLPYPFAPKLLRRLAVARIDPRIHFALNCGARSCPPIAFYSPDKLDGQLDLAARSFLESETDLYPEKKEAHTTRLLLWYQGDFGGMRGVRKALESVLGQDLAGWRVRFKGYDWGGI